MHTSLRLSQLRHGECGVAALVVILILLFSISGITLYAANTGILEQKVSTNDYRAKQLAEAADAGINYAQAWLASNTNSATWGTADASGNQTSTSIGSTSMSNGFSAAITLTRPITMPDHVLITSTATETGGSLVTAVAKLSIVQKKVMTGLPDSPMVVNGCVSSTVGTPTIENQQLGSTYEIISSQNALCVNQGNFNGGYGFDVQGGAFVGSAWDRSFGMTQAEMQTLAAVPGSNVYWNTQTTPYHTDLGSVGPPAQPVVAIFTGCPSINGGTTIVGVVYFVGPCTTNGWGGGNIFGTLIVDGDVALMNANTALIYDEDYVGDLVDDYVGVKGRIPGTWLDE